MNNRTLLDALEKLAKLNSDAVIAYQTVIETIKEINIKASFADFKEEHQRNFDKLNHEIMNLGGESVSQCPAIKDILVDILIALRSSFSTKSALNVIQSNEEVTYKNYDYVLNNMELPNYIKDILVYDRNNVKSHIQYVKRRLQDFKFVNAE